jgi:hypothetical protein
MPFIKKPITLEWTMHAQAKMRHYGLSPSRVRRVLHSPRRTEEGIAPDTIAVMQPASLKSKDVWTQEIWVMVTDGPSKGSRIRRVISAWRYPGVTKPRAPAILAAMQREYNEFRKGS